MFFYVKNKQHFHYKNVQNSHTPLDKVSLQASHYDSPATWMFLGYFGSQPFGEAMIVLLGWCVLVLI